MVRLDDFESAREFARAGKISLPLIERFGRADEHGLCFASFTRDNIEHVVHPVDEVDVRMTSRAEHDLGPFCPAFGGVGSKVIGAEICFGFYDARPVLLAPNTMHENCSDQSARKLDRVLMKK